MRSREITHATLHVMVQGNQIVVTLPGSSYKAFYSKPEPGAPLVASAFPKQDYPEAEITASRFMAFTWHAASGKARELGWLG